MAHHFDELVPNPNKRVSMSENENGNSPQEDPTEVKTTIGMPMPPRPVETSSAEPAQDELVLNEKGSTAEDAEEEESLVVSEEAEDSAEDIINLVAKDSSPSADQNLSGENDGETLSVLTWPIDPEHANAVSVLSEQLSGVKIYGSSYVAPQGSRALNFILLVLVIGVGIAGSMALQFYGSADREARLMEAAICKADYDALVKLTAQKQYGKLVIESAPEQAKVFQQIDGGPMVELMGKTADGKEMATLTPATLDNLDINRMYRFKLKFTETLKRAVELSDKEKKELKEGEKPPIEEMGVDYRDEEFTVARYQWIQDGATGSFRFQKIVPLTPDYIDHYYTFNWSKGEAKRFEEPGGKAECEAYRQDNSDSSLCRAIPRTEDFEKKDAREEAAKKGNKGKKRRRR
jgi:hypothetical protein